MSTRDRIWAPLDAIRAVGPLADLTPGAVRAALHRWHAADPAARPLSRMDLVHRRWVPADSPDGILLDVDPTGPATVDTVVRRLLPLVPGDRPMLLAVHGGYLAARISHGVGDGRVVNPLLLDLLRMAVEDRPSPTGSSRTRLPLPKAAARHFARHPAALVAAGRVALPPPAVPPASARPWQPELCYASARSAPDGLRRLRGWRDAYAPGASAAAVVFAATSAALRLVGLRPYRPGIVVLVDARRYLPAGSTVDGNFSWGQYLVPGDSEDPYAIDAVLRAEVASGRALVMLALRDARTAVLPGGVTVPTTVDSDARPELTVSHLGRLDGYADLPWTGPEHGYRFVCVPPPAGPAGVTFSYAEMAGALHVTAAFHGSTFEPAAMDRAVQLVATGPVELLRPAPRGAAAGPSVRPAAPRRAPSAPSVPPPAR